MAEVYRGWTTGAEGFQRLVAIKRVLPGYSDNPQFAAMFVNEARLASLLHHDNVVAVLDFDRDGDGRLFQVLEFVDGRDLEKLAAAGPLPIGVIAYVIGEVLRGLDHAHTAAHPVTGRGLGLVHRDCTPSNVLITYGGAGGSHVKVSDFGVAKAVQSTLATQSRTAKGKPGYMSAEQLDGALDLDGRSDLFAVGVMMWELLAGRRLFVADSVQGVLSEALGYAKGWIAIPRIEDVARVDPELARLVGDLLARDRAARPASAVDALARLEPWIPSDGARQLARCMAAAFPRTTMVATAPPTAPPTAPTVTGPPRRKTQPMVTPWVGGEVAATTPPPTRSRARIAIAVVGIAMVGGAVGVGIGNVPVTVPVTVPVPVTVSVPVSVPVDAMPIDAMPIDAMPIDATAIDARANRAEVRGPRPEAHRQSIIEMDLGGGNR